MILDLIPVCFNLIQISDILCWNWFGFPDSSVEAVPGGAAAAAAAARICLLAFLEFPVPDAPPVEPMRLI